MNTYNEQELKRDDAQFIANTYAKNDLVLTKAKGSEVFDINNKRYLDFTSGIGVNSLGFCDEKWVAAVYGQLQNLQHISNLYFTQPCINLAKELCTRTKMEKVFFANSGAEANEGAIKAARKYSSDKYGESRHTIITLEGSFHGRTLAALKATGQEVFHRHFAPFIEGFEYAPPNDYSAMESLVKRGDVCAVMLEVVQGEGGVNPLSEDYVKKVHELCNANDVLLIVDEVQTGIGRTGSLLALEQYGISADIVTLAKGLGGGLPIGAILFSQKTQNTLTTGDHGSTFGANPVVCAGALEVLNRLTPEFLLEVKAKGEQLEQALLKLDSVLEVNAKGLMIGIVFKEGINAKDVLLKCQENGLLCLTAKTKLRLLPPLTVSEGEIEEAIEIIKNTLEGM